MPSQLLMLAYKNVLWIKSRKFYFLFELLIPYTVTYLFFKNSSDDNEKFYQFFQNVIIVFAVSTLYIPTISNTTTSYIHDINTNTIKHYTVLVLLGNGNESIFVSFKLHYFQQPIIHSSNSMVCIFFKRNIAN